MLPSSRRKRVAKLNLCPNCLYNHNGKGCISDRRCRECNKDHNSLLHETIKQKGIATPETAAERAGPSGASSSNAYSGKHFKSSSHVSLPNEPIEVLLPTAIIKVESADGTPLKMRCLLDQGSQTSLITERAAQLLRLPRRSCKGVISGVGNKESNCRGLITLKCSSLITDFKFETEVLIMKSLIKNLPSYTFSQPDWPYLDHIKLADPEFYVSRPVDILLGADVYSAILLDGICRVNSTLPTAQQTQLGWILSGNVKTFQCNVVLHNYEDIYKFWELEDISEPAETSSEDQHCLEYYQATTKRREDGRYEVRLPMKPNYQGNLGHSKNKAIGQFFKLEQKFQKQPDIAQQYKLFINEYLSLGHMILVGKDGNMTPECFLPHHCVERPESETTQLRVVFNGKSKTSSGFSLNDLMCRGPNLQQDLQSLIIKWRQYQFAFTADIEKMFRQIWLNPEDSKLQKIIWRDDPSKNLKIYQLATVTYGTKAAPFLAMCTIRQLARDERPNYQESSAPRVLQESFYMDDLIHGAHSVDSAKQLKRDLSSLLSSGGFNLRKWKSNLPDLLEEATSEKNNQGNFDFKQAESTKTLGLGWNPQTDCFTFNSKLTTSLSKPTKRIMLSEISKQYDPMGWISPLTTKLKILFQETWRVDIKWDEYVPNEIHVQWNEVRADIELINCYHVPRWLGTMEKDRIELHGFCDASTKAYACVVYCKIQREDSTLITLVAAKTKLVPLKKMLSLPRLELSGAVLLSNLMAKIMSNLSSYEIKIYGWVDSTAVLGWLHGDPERWKPFVANRVKQITATMPPECWRYVKSKENPADCASRGLNSTQLKDHTLWWQGPNWLTSFCQENEKQGEYTTDQEMRKIKSVSVTQVFFKHEIIQRLLTSYSSLSKCVKTLGWILRFIYRKSKENYLSVSELRVAKVLIIKQVQQEEFYKEIKELQERNSVNSKSKLYELIPILDKDGVLRVGGRLRNETKHPAIIPRLSRLASLIIDEAHELTYHGGARLTTAFMRRNYWLLGGIRTTKSRLRHCVKCRRHSPHQNYQLMGDLPSARSNPSRSFFHTGVDYSGFVSVKASKGRGIKTTKGYIVVFVCMATKAVHLELASDLTASAFLAALRRMAARRGTPGHIDRVIKAAIS